MLPNATVIVAHRPSKLRCMSTGFTAKKTCALAAASASNRCELAHESRRAPAATSNDRFVPLPRLRRTATAAVGRLGAFAAAGSVD